MMNSERLMNKEFEKDDQGKGRYPNEKNFSIRALPQLEGGVSLREFFAPFFYLSKSLVNGRDGGKSR